MSSRFRDYDRYSDDDVERYRADDRQRHRQQPNRQSTYDLDRERDSSAFYRGSSSFSGSGSRGYSRPRERDADLSDSHDYSTGYRDENTYNTLGRNYGLGRSGYDDREGSYNQRRPGRQDYERGSSVSQYGGNYRPNFEATDDAFGSYETFLRDRPDARPYGYNRESSYPYRDRSRSPSHESRQERSWWDRVTDELASWFGDESAERRRRMDEAGATHRGKGPRGYKRSDERIREDINDRLTEYEYLDATDIEVLVSEAVVTLTGNVDSRGAKRAAEGIVDTVSGVEDIQNNLRVVRNPALETSSTTPSSTVSATTAKTQSKTAGT